MRARRFIVVALAAGAAIMVIRRRRTELVEIQFDDGSSIRLTAGADARDLLEDAHAIVEAAR